MKTTAAILVEKGKPVAARLMQSEPSKIEFFDPERVSVLLRRLA